MAQPLLEVQVAVPAAGTAFSCFDRPTGEIAPNSLMTSCFYGALIFLTALIVATRILRSKR